MVNSRLFALRAVCHDGGEMRDLTQEALDRLTRPAKEHDRSLDEKVKVITPFTIEEATRVAAQWRRRLAGRMTSDSADLIREDRDL